MTALILTPAAIRAILLAAQDDLRQLRYSGASGRLDTLAIALDPAHQPAAPAPMSLHDIIRAPRFAGDTTFGHIWPEDIGSAMHAPPAPTAGAAAAQRQATMPTATAAAANCPDAANAGTPAPPTIELPASLGSGADHAPEAPPPAQAAVGRSTRREQAIRGGPRKAVWTPERETLLRRDFPTCTDSAALLAALNALPGDAPIASVAAVGQRAIKLGIKRTPETLRQVLRQGAAQGLVAANASRLATIAQATEADPRAQALRDLWHQPITMRDIIARLNELDGPTITYKAPVYELARRLGLPTPRHADEHQPRADGAPPTPAPTPPPAEPAEPTPEESAAIADAAMETKHDGVRASLRTALKEHRGAPPVVALSQIGTRAGLPLREVMRLLGEVRAEAAA